MKNERFFVVLAVAVCTFMGTLLAVEISSRFAYGGQYLWAFGALLGGIVGGSVFGAFAYCAVDFQNFWAGIVHSYRKTIAWRPDPLYWRTLCISFGGVAVLYNSMICVGAGILMCFVGIGPDYVGIYILLGTLAVVTLLAFVLGWAMVLGANGAEDRVERLQDVRDTGWDMMKNTNPIGMLYWAFVGLAWVAVRAPSALSRFVSSVSQTARTLKQFIVGVLVYVHSEGRRIALTDTFFCTIVGSFVESAIIGVVVGAVVSYVDYELISVRLLKLIPARAK